MNIKTLNTPVGAITLFAVEQQIIVVEWGRAGSENESCPLLEEAGVQLNAYFDGRLKNFDLPLEPEGTEFQKSVWQQMSQIPYGETRSYGDLSDQLQSAPRAVGGACGKNPIPIIIPCHRILGGNGKMTGYSGGDGIETKMQLLRLEGAIVL